MPSPVRFTAGVNTAVKNSTLKNYPLPDPTRVHEFFDDFNEYKNTSGGTTDSPWVEDVVNSTSFVALADEPFGAIKLTNTGADNDMINIQWHLETFTLGATGKKCWFKTRFKVSDATESDWLVGLAVLDASLITAGGGADGDGVTDGIFFSKDDGDTDIDFQCQKDATTGQLRKTAIGTCTTNYVVLGFEYDGFRYIDVYKDDVKVYTMDLTATATDYLPNTPVSVGFSIMNGAGAAKTMTIDYVFAAIER